MSQPYWKTGVSDLPKKEVRWPTAGQALVQLVTASIVLVVWAGLFWAYMQVIESSGPTIAEAAGLETPAAAIEPTAPATVTPLPTATNTPVSTVTPLLTLIAAPSEPAAADVPAPPSLTPTLVASTATPTTSPTPTETTLPPAGETSTATDSAAISFSQDVLPVFEQRCVKCHGGDKTEEGLVLTNYADILAGSWNGPVVEPGNVADSYLVEQIESGKMPKKGPRLLPAEIRAIRAWIAAGAPNN